MEGKRRQRAIGYGASMCVDEASICNLRALKLMESLLDPTVTQIEQLQTIGRVIVELSKVQRALYNVPMAAREDLEQEAGRLLDTGPLDPVKLRGG